MESHYEWLKIYESVVNHLKHKKCLAFLDKNGIKGHSVHLLWGV